MFKYQLGKAFPPVMLKDLFSWWTVQFIPVVESLIPNVCHLSLLVVNIMNIPKSSVGVETKKRKQRGGIAKKCKLIIFPYSLTACQN